MGCSTKTRIIISVVVIVTLLAVASGLITWLVLANNARLGNQYETILLEGEGIGTASQTSAFARFRQQAHMFWWFFPALNAASESRPIILWLDGVTGLPPSLLANFGIIGPYDFNLDERNGSWVEDYNVLFVDAPVGSGFSFVGDQSQAARSLEDNSDDLLIALHSFYSHHESLSETPLYIFGQGFGGRMAADLALVLQQRIEKDDIDWNLQGVLLANPIISPALVTSKLGFYLEELGYIDNNGRAVIENLAEEMQNLVEQESYLDALEKWSGLEETVSETAGAVAVNLHHIVEKMTRDPTGRAAPCPQCSLPLRAGLPASVDVTSFMDGTVAPALGVFSDVSYDSQRDWAVAGLAADLMKPAHVAIEKLLQETELDVWIFNGNLDAICNTPGQLLWIESLEWSGAADWLNSERTPLSVEGHLQGYLRSSGRLHLYWINAAGHVVSTDSPVAMRDMLLRIAGF